MYVDTEEGKNETKWENVTASLCSLTCLAWEMIWPSENLKTPKSWHRDWVQEAKCSSSREVCIHWETHETQHNRGNMSGEPNKDSVFFSFLFFTQLLTAWECFFLYYSAGVVHILFPTVTSGDLELIVKAQLSLWCSQTNDIRYHVSIRQWLVCILGWIQWEEQKGQQVWPEIHS